jgi:hypothetical protein
LYFLNDGNNKLYILSLGAPFPFWPLFGDRGGPPYMRTARVLDLKVQKVHHLAGPGCEPFLENENTLDLEEGS